MTISAAVQWATIEQAIVTFIRTVTGIPVIWSAQNKARPAAPYIALRWRGASRVPNNFVNVVDNPLTFAAKPASGVAGSTIALTAHGLALGDGPVQLTTTGALPTGLALATDYWVIPIDADHVQLATSFKNARAGAFVTLSSAGTGTLSVNATANTLKAGQEILLVAGAFVDVTLSMQCFAAPTVGAAGPSSAVAILDQVLAAYMLPSQHDALNNAGVTIYDFGNVTPLDGVINSSVFEPRAVAEVKIYLDSNISEPGTIIESVQVEDQTDAVTFEVDS